MMRVVWGLLVMVLAAGLMVAAVPPASAQQTGSDQYAPQDQTQPSTDQTETAPAAPPAGTEQQPGATMKQQPSTMGQQPGTMAQPAPQVQAPTAAPGEYPNVASLRPFSPEANYMSVPGYLRWQVWRDQGTWLSYAEARRIVIAQGGQLYRAA